MKKVIYLAISYVTAFLFEFIYNTIGDGKLFTSDHKVVFFLAWYGLLYLLLLYFIIGFVPALCYEGVIKSK